MLILLFVFALIRHLHGAPTSTLPIPGSDPSDFFARDDPSHHGTRQLSDIIVSCMATIFACTWTAIHPNIPGPCDSGWDIFKRQVTTMTYAILAPEAITGWALRQNIDGRQAYTLVERHKQGWFRRNALPPALGQKEAVRWTTTHGFLLQMGGLMMSKNGRPVQIMNEYFEHRNGIIYHIHSGDVCAPTITEAEIQDRSKGDGLTKTFVVLQTTWFIAQCIVRWSSSLPVTELEVTLGFAMLNGITYALWWNKPQSVGMPVYLEMKDNGGAGVTEGIMSEVDESERGEERPIQPIEDQTMAALEEERHNVVEEQVPEGGDSVVEKRVCPREGQAEQIRSAVQTSGTQDEGQDQPADDQIAAPTGEEQQVDVEEQVVEGNRMW